MIKKHLKKNKKKILNSWFCILMDVFPKDKSQFLRKNKDSFANPIGSISFKSLENIILELSENFNEKKIKKDLEAILKILAIQEFKPSVALSFVLPLKKIIKDTIKEKNIDFSNIDLQIEKMLLIAFDIFIANRELIFKFKANHIKERTLNLLQKSGVLCEVPDFGTEIISKNVYQSDAFQAEIDA